MGRVDPAVTPPPEGDAQPRCGMCRRFARLLPGETKCAHCSGVLALEFPVITVPSNAAQAGGW